MFTGFKHTHSLVVVIFILIFLYKTFLLLTNKKEDLKAFREKWKIADMILGSLILVTGAYLYFNSATAGAFHIFKLVVSLASIPLGIIAFKKEIKPIAIVVSLLFLFILLASFTHLFTAVATPGQLKESVVKDTVTTPNSILDQNANAVSDLGKQIYVQNCVVCHGEDGKLGLSGAKDLSVTAFTHQEKIAIVKSGSGDMPAFKQFSDQDLEAIATYVDGLKK